MSMYERDDVDLVMREIGVGWWETSVQEIPGLLIPAIKRVSERHGVDSGYVLWSLMNAPKSWRGVPGSTFLSIARRLLITSSFDYGRVKYQIPDFEGEQQVNDALKDLGKWADTTLSKAVWDILTDLAKRNLKRIQKGVLEVDGRDISRRDAMLLVMTELPLRIKDHPFWFTHTTTLGMMAGELIGT